MGNLKLLSSLVFLACSAHASIITLGGALSAANENPTNPSTATGSAFVTVDTVALTITFNVVFSGLTGNDTAAHIHCCVAQGGNTGVATAIPALPGFPLGVTSGLFDGAMFSLLDASFYNPSFITINGGTVASAEPVFLAGLLSDQAYFNIHTPNNPGGEIRAFLIPVPEPASVYPAALTLLGLAAMRRRRK